MSNQSYQEMTAHEASRSGAEVLEWPSPGARLRKLREEQQLSQPEVAERLHLTVHYINALEQDQYEKLPGRVFIKGYIRSYCTLLGVDPEELVGCYERFTAEHNGPQRESGEPRRQQRRRDQSRAWLAGAACLLVIIAGLSWWFAGRQDTTPVVVPPTVNNGAGDVERSDPLAVERAARVGGEADDSLAEVEPATPATVAVASRDAAATAESTGEQAGSLAMNAERTDSGRRISLQGEGQDRVDISTHGTSWIEIDNGAGERVFSDMLQKGDELHLRSTAPFNILFGDATQVAVDFNEEAVDLRALIRSDNSARITLER